MSECIKCEGVGGFFYSTTATYRSTPGGIAGQGFTWDVCNECWGSGDGDKPWTNIVALEAQVAEMRAENARLVQEVQVCHEERCPCQICNPQEVKDVCL